VSDKPNLPAEPTVPGDSARSEDPAGRDPAERSIQPSPQPPPSGVDLARALLAQARVDARARGRATLDRRAARRGEPGRTSGAHPDDRDPQPLKESVRRLLASRGWETQAAVGGVVGRWPEIVGAELAEHCVPDGFADGVLVVRADSTAWATQVRSLAPQLVHRLNKEVGHGTVTRVEVRGPGGPSWRKGRLRVRGRGPRDTYG
jgi:predicted nucleic acid-binding Zn ribbon protein